MRFIFALIAASAFAISPAVAEDGGFYVGAGVGDFGIDLGPVDGSDTGFKLFGGYLFNKNFGVELEYLDGGTADFGPVGIDVSGFNLSGIGILPVGEKFNLFAKLGMLFWDASLSGKGGGDDSGEDFSWGIGAGYSFTDQFGMRLEYQGFEIEDTDTVDLLSVGASWKF